MTPSKTIVPQNNKDRSTNKVVVVDLSCHQKTLSSSFFFNELRQHFDLQVIFEESWLGAGPFPDLSFVDDRYLALILWQSIIPLDALKNIRNDNVIFVPMYDSVLHTQDVWEDYKALRIINFSSTLHQRVSSWGFESMYLQYFPELGEFTPGDSRSVFFWQRRTEFGFDKVKQFFDEYKFKIHIHIAPDDESYFTNPLPEDHNRFGITYSTWFNNKEDFLTLMKQKGIFVAPRRFEGIGMSFLEAMAFGKAVIAVNNPTMNEYIVHGHTGYLFDFDSPSRIDLSKISEVQKNTYEYMREGRKNWERDRSKIIDFIIRRR